MPELPEVENLVSELGRTLPGCVISSVKVQNGEILKSPRAWFSKSLLGKSIVRISRRGKFIRMDLTDGLLLWFHLGMTGQLLLGGLPPKLGRHTHLVLSFRDTKQRLYFRDPRRFGQVVLTREGEEAFPSGVKRLGPEPKEWGTEEFVSCLKKRRGRIKNLLLNQRLMAGLGNIYADESLHRAGIHPLRRAERIPRKRLSRLHQAICEVLGEAIRWGGSSIDDYLHLNGEKGRFQEFHKVYGRAGKDCPGCGTPIQRLKLSGRSSAFCPHCQR